MLNKDKHQRIMAQILRDIYSETSISSLLGFKGGTCAYFFYGLTRFSVDLDFDLLVNDEATQQLVFEKIGNLLKAYGEVKDQYIKYHTVFFLLSYGDADHNVKVEVNVRVLMPDIKAHYELKKYLGISMLVGKKDYLFASKLVALTDRKVLATRDIYDVWFFAKNNWDINAEVIKARTGKTLEEQLSLCISTVESVKDKEILHGLAELLPDEKAKTWVKAHLRDETIFMLKNYQTTVG